jgi:Flp pilus assembly protein protease CpaA
VAGTTAVVVVAMLTIRRRPIGNSLIVAGVGVAAAGTAVAGLGIAASAVFITFAAVLLYLGFLRRT